MRELHISADDLVDRLLASDDEGMCILDSCGVGHLNSHLLIAGLSPSRIIIADDGRTALQELDRIVGGNEAAIFTLSYDLGNHIQGVSSARVGAEPLAFIATFNSLIVHDYDSGSTNITGSDSAVSDLERSSIAPKPPVRAHIPAVSARSSTARSVYLQTIEAIKEEIRCGNTYQTNLTRQIEARLHPNVSESAVFQRLRSRHPAPFSAYIKRPGSTVISASPERFFKIENGSISASPIKGTRPRGADLIEDERLRNELLNSDKDRAENTMIVDLLRNDLGRVCAFGSVAVESLCEIEEHPSLFHLVSTISGNLRPKLKFSEILAALFPCGSITGAPKLSTMKIIDRLESTPRGLSMGAIGYYMPASFGIEQSLDLSVAIRTMVIKDQSATFNVGGGIVIDSDPEKEWDETVTKSRALLDALGIDPNEVAE
ncbi:MAG: aminodeoxychorismate synthase component I [bacterium]|nr:aminodeoxychorismate synthase component I [bacterium]